jgi:hypothetical protein
MKEKGPIKINTITINGKRDDEKQQMDVATERGR